MAQMTFWQFAGEHPALAVFFVVLAASVAVVLAGLFIAWRVSRPVKYTAADRAALTAAAARLRHTALNYGADAHFDSRDATRDEASALERMAAR